MSRRNPLILDDYGSFCELVAEKYIEAPDFDEDEVWRWELLADHVEDFYKKILHNVDVEFVDGQPYDSAEHMKEEVEATGVLEVSQDFNHHPIFTPLQNLKLRAVHDYIVHILGKSDFSRRGEIRAYNLHRRLAPRDTWPALFTEVAAQACYANTFGDFHPVQKIAVLDGVDFYRVGKIDGQKIEGKKLKAKRRYEEREMFPPARANPALEPHADVALLVKGEREQQVGLILIDTKVLRKMTVEEFEGEGQVVDGPVPAILGYLSLDAPAKGAEPDDHYYSVGLSAARKGWGPLLYELGISFAQKRSLGLRPDVEVSYAAERVWQVFYDRADVAHESRPRSLHSREKVHPEHIDNVFRLAKPRRLATFTSRWKANRKIMARRWGGPWAKKPARIDDKILYTAFEMTDWKVEDEAWGRHPPKRRA